MARTFSKNLSNYMMVTTQRNAIGNLLNGASKIAAHCWFKYGTLSTLDLRDYIFSFPIASNSEGLGLGIQYNSGNRRLRARARSGSGDGGQLKIGNTTLSSGTGYYGGAIWDIGGDSIEVFLNGASDGSGGVTFVNSTWTLGSFAGSGVDLESIGCVCGTSGSAPTNLDQMFDGDIAELAIWAGSAVPSAADFAALGAGVSPLLVFPSTLIAYWPLLGDASPERDRINRNEPVITGSIPVADHPKIYYPRPTTYSFAAASAATFTGSAAVTVGAATCSASGTFTKPTYTGTGAVTVGAATCSASGTFTKPTYSATAGATVAPATCSGSAAFTKPTYTATAGVTIAPATCAGSAIFANAVFQASAAVTTGKATVAGSATFTKPSYTGTVGATIGPATCSGAATFAKPVFTGSAAVTIGRAVCQGSAIFASAVFQGAANVTVAGAQCSAVATFAAGSNPSAGTPEMTFTARARGHVFSSPDRGHVFSARDR